MCCRGLKNDAPLVGRLRLRHAFVIAQVAFSIVLLIGAGLFIRALHRSASIDPGFDSHGVELMSIDLAQAGYTNMTGPPFVRELLDRVRQLPGVQTATIASVLPGGFEVRREALTVPGGSSPSAPAFVTVDWNVVEPGYFATLRTPIVAGRDFTAADRNGTQPVAIVSEAAARQFWPATGRRRQVLVATDLGPAGADPSHADPARGWRGARHTVQQPDRWSGARLGVRAVPAAVRVEHDDCCAHDPWAAHR